MSVPNDLAWMGMQEWFKDEIKPEHFVVTGLCRQIINTWASCAGAARVGQWAGKEPRMADGIVSKLKNWAWRLKRDAVVIVALWFAVAAWLWVAFGSRWF